MAHIETKLVEVRPGKRLLFAIVASNLSERMEFPVAIDDQGSAALNEAAALRSTIAFATDLAASAKLRIAAR